MEAENNKTPGCHRDNFWHPILFKMVCSWMKVSFSEKEVSSNFLSFRSSKIFSFFAKPHFRWKKGTSK